MKKSPALSRLLLLALITALGLIAGCTSTGGTSVSRDVSAVGECESLFVNNDKLILDAGVADAQYARVKNFPYLRVNRLYAALKSRLSDEKTRRAWISDLANLDHLARTIEMSNLPASIVKSDDGTAQLARCRESLVSSALNDKHIFEQIMAAANVPDNYRWQQRLAGLYALSRWPVYLGVKRLQKNENPKKHTAGSANTQHYTGYGSDTVKRTTPSPALGFPQFTELDIAGLLNRFEPVWSINTTTRSDSIGKIAWVDNKIAVDTTEPTVYRYISYALFENRLLLQLNYTIWLPAVDSSKPLDIYAGEIDGLTFRVTLDETKTPLYADVMHNCGCYYMGFPRPSLAPILPMTTATAEPLWIPYSLPPLRDDQQYQLLVDTGKHFVRALTTTVMPSRLTHLQRQPYDALRRLERSDGGTRSAFSPRALIENSARLERLILWPMGVISAGAMRQVGNHAIAFVGKRHFDDPELISKHFRSAQRPRDQNN